jgi:uncharacterized membrane protein YesL
MKKFENRGTTFKWFKLFFSKYTLIGVILVLISIIISTNNKSEQLLKTILTIFATLIQTIGIAFIVGSVFDFSKNSKEFTEFVANLLSNIVVSKEFLCKLTKEDKKDQYKFRESDDSKKLDICSTDWLDSYTGFSIVIAKK